MIEEAKFNGYVISDFYQVINVQRPIAGRVNETTHVSGSDGVRLSDTFIDAYRVGVTILMPTTSLRERREAIRELSMMLHTEEPAMLEFGSDNGLYYMAILDGDVPVSEHVRTDLVTMNFAVDSPILYGAARSVTVPDGGMVTFNVSGTYPTEPTIRGTVTGNENGLWGVRLDDGEYVRLEVGTESRNMEIDCQSRTAKVSGALRLPTLSSDWLRMGRGTHTLRNDIGSGACVVSWVERWL